MGSRKDNNWSVVVKFSGAAEKYAHMYLTCRKKKKIPLALTHVAQKLLALIVESREIVLHGADLRKLIIRALQGSMC